jgi:adenylate kinase
MKMSPAAKTYLISGYPRSMRDVVEYSEKVNAKQTAWRSASDKILCLLMQIQVINGVVLISWRQAVLQRQIDYGAKLGHGESPHPHRRPT